MLAVGLGQRNQRARSLDFVLQLLHAQLLHFFGKLPAGEFALAKGKRFGGQFDVVTSAFGRGRQLRRLRAALSAFISALCLTSI